MTTKVHGNEDADLEFLENKTISIIGYGNQGHAQAQNLRDSGCNVIIGNRPNDDFWKKAEEDGFDVFEIPEAVQRGDIVHILVPDEIMANVYKEKVSDHLDDEKILGFSHGFSVYYEEIEPPNDIDVIMVAPKSPGSMARRNYKRGSGVPGLVAVYQNKSGNALNIALAMAKGIGLTRRGVVETTFEEEVVTDLVGEQTVLVGGVTALIKAGFETLVDEGYKPENAYFECLNELKLIVDLIHSKGIEGMMSDVSNTAEYGGRTRGPKLIDSHVREKMQDILDEVQDGSFAEEWIQEQEEGLPNLKKMREEGKNHLIEKVGEEIREWALLQSDND